MSFIIPEDIPTVINPWRCRFDFSRPDQFITASGNDVVSMKDAFGTGITAAQATSGNRPKTGLSTQNGLNVVTFNGSQFLNVSVNTPLSEPFTVFCVGQSDNPPLGSDQAFIGRQTSSIAGQWVLLRHGTFSIFQSYLFGSGGLDSGSTQPSNTSGNIHTVTFQNGAKLRYQLNNNTATEGNTRSGYDNNVATGLAIGASNPSMGAPLRGWIGEIIIYGFVLSADQIAGINRYLSKKWGIAIS